MPFKVPTFLLFPSGHLWVLVLRKQLITVSLSILPVFAFKPHSSPECHVIQARARRADLQGWVFSGPRPPPPPCSVSLPPTSDLG